MNSIIFALEAVGTVAFAVSGAMAAIFRHFDLFGVLFCAVITSLGGGTIRDVLLGKTPPAMFTDYSYLIIAFAAALITFLAASVLKNRFEQNSAQIDSVNNIFDALGLGVFTIIGIKTAVSAGYSDNLFFAIFLGTTTGCGGGILRDIIIREIPFVFTKRIYAVASLAGGTLYGILSVICKIPEPIAVFSGIIVIFLLRLFASVFRWDLPKAY